MRSVSFRICVGLVALLATARLSQAVPVAQLSPTEPGLNIVIPFVGPDAFGNTYFAYPTQWGGYSTGGGFALSVDNRLAQDSDNGFIRYRTTLPGVNPANGQYTVTPMDVTKDWVMSMEWKSDMQEALGTVFEASAILQDVARLRTTSPGVFELQGGDGGGPYASIKTFPAGYLQADTNYVLTLHYKASSQLMDFYINNTLEAANFPAPGTTPDFAVDFLQMGGGPAPVSMGINSFQNIKIGVLGTAAKAGDFDGDGDVDGADFVAWQTNFPKATGATLAQGDADADGDVDGADFVVWQTNFPFTPGAGAAPVPEPMSATLLVLGGAALCFGRRFVGSKRAS